MIIAGLLDSVIRNRSDIKIFFLMNAVDGIEYSPLFSFFNLSVPYGNDIKLFKNNLVLVQYMENKEFREERKSTLIRSSYGTVLATRNTLWKIRF